MDGASPLPDSSNSTDAGQAQDQGGPEMGDAQLGNRADGALEQGDAGATLLSVAPVIASDCSCQVSTVNQSSNISVWLAFFLLLCVVRRPGSRMS